jgi:hypothetical protein
MPPPRLSGCGPRAAGEARSSATRLLSPASRSRSRPKCERRESNPHALRHWNLNPARLPVSPLSRRGPFTGPSHTLKTTAPRLGQGGHEESGRGRPPRWVNGAARQPAGCREPFRRHPPPGRCHTRSPPPQRDRPAGGSCSSAGRWRPRPLLQTVEPPVPAAATGTGASGGSAARGSRLRGGPLWQAFRPAGDRPFGGQP